MAAPPMSTSKEEIIIGIDLGTTNSLVGVVESGFPIILADENGDRIQPSAVAFRPGEDPVVGKPALRARELAPESTITSVKRFMGRSFSQLTAEDHEDGSFSLQATESDRIGIQIDPTTEATVSPELVSSEILKHLKQIAENALEQEVNRAVVTVPAYFNNSQREATKRAAEMAGLVVERILNEPTAAALAYGLDKLDENQVIAVYDFGGGTFDLSVLQLKEGIFEVVATAGDTRLGGDDIDSAIAQWAADQWNLGELNPEESSRLLSEARKAKEALSEAEATDLRLPFFRDGESYEIEITRDSFHRLLLPLIERTRLICQRAFAEAENKGVPTVQHLILVGGSTRIPLVREKLKEWFGLEPNLSQHPDEAVGLGAAIQAGMLCGRVRSVILVDVTPLSLGIETFGGLMNVIIPRNSTIPAKAGELFTNAVAQQDAMAIRVLQGEREMAKDNWLLGEISVPFTPGPKGSARVGVQFAINENGILEVLARDTETGEDHLLAIENSAVDVDDEEVEKMIGESIDYAFEDMNERVWTEARFKSEELLPAVSDALQQVGDTLPEEDREAIEAAAEAVRKLLESPEKDAQALKEANRMLDQQTETLAALVIEAAFGDLS